MHSVRAQAGKLNNLGTDPHPSPVEDGAGNDTRFWTLAQALSALDPSTTDEKRWVDGVLARKKGLGF